MTDSLWSVHVIMPGPSRGHRAHQKVIDEKDVLPYVQPAGPHIGNYYSTYSDDLSPLSSFRSLPANLFALTQPNGDVILRYGGGEEADFDVIGMVIGTCLEAPSGFPKSSLPHFRRWVKLGAVDEPLFSAAVEASEVLYNFLALSATDVLPQPVFLAGSTRCFRPSATVLTSLEVLPDAPPAEIPPLYTQAPLEAAIRAGHGKYCFSADNEVLFFGDDVTPDGDIIRREISPTAVTVGQIVQVKMKFRLLKQDNGKYVFRELLKGISVLHHGASMDIARNMAQACLGKGRSAKREVKFYTLARSKAQGHTGPGRGNEGGTD